MDEQWGYVGAKSRQRWLFYAYDRLRKTVVAHVFGERTMATLGRLMSLLSPFDVVGSDSNLLIVFYVQIMPDDLVMQLHRF